MSARGKGKRRQRWAERPNFVQLMTAGRVVDAMPQLAENLRADPTNPQALYEAAVTCIATGQREMGVGMLRLATQLAPGNPLYWYNLGSATLPLGNVEEAAVAWSHCLQIAPRSISALVAMAGVQRQLGDEVGMRVFQDAAWAEGERRPLNAEERYSLSFLKMLRGDWRIGFQDFDERHGLPWFLTQQGRETLKLKTPGYRWTGKRVIQEGRLLIHTEQGLGDAVQGVRWVQAARQAAGVDVVLECHHQLTTLFESQHWDGVEIVQRGKDLPTDIVAYCPMFTIPSVLGMDRPDLVPQPLFTAAEEPVIPPGGPTSPVLTVGLCWAGSKDHTNDFDRSCPWDVWKTILDTPGHEHVRWVSLIVDDERAADLLPHPEVVDIRTVVRDVKDTAAVMAQCDLVISVDTAGAHLAASLGKEVWMFPPTAPEWRWGLGGVEDRLTHWYPTMRLFRRVHYKRWQIAIDRVKMDLASLIARRAGAADGSGD